MSNSCYSVENTSRKTRPETGILLRRLLLGHEEEDDWARFKILERKVWHKYLREKNQQTNSPFNKNTIIGLKKLHGNNEHVQLVIIIEFLIFVLIG